MLLPKCTSEEFTVLKEELCLFFFISANSLTSPGNSRREAEDIFPCERRRSSDRQAKVSDHKMIVPFEGNVAAEI